MTFKILQLTLSLNTLILSGCLFSYFYTTLLYTSLFQQVMPSEDLVLTRHKFR